MKKNTNKIFKGAVATTMILNVVSPITALAYDSDDYEVIDTIEYTETDVEAIVETVEEEAYEYVEETSIVEEVYSDELTENEDVIIEVVEEKEIEEIEIVETSEQLRIIDIFQDSNLAQVIATELGLNVNDEIELSDLSVITELNARESNIQSLNGIENLTGLTNLDLFMNSISDVSPLSGLTNLTYLSVHSNRITDLRPLANLNIDVVAWAQGIYLNNVEVGTATELLLFDIDGSSINLGIDGVIGIETIGEFTFENNQLVWTTAGNNRVSFESGNSRFSGTIHQTVTGNNLNDDNGNDNNNDGSDNNDSNNNDNNNNDNQGTDGGNDTNNGSDDTGSNDNNNVTTPPSDNNNANNNNNGQTLPQTGAIETSFALMGGFMLSTGAVVSFIKNKKQ